MGESRKRVTHGTRLTSIGGTVMTIEVAAQEVEHWNINPMDPGSRPTGRRLLFFLVSLHKK